MSVSPRPPSHRSSRLIPLGHPVYASCAPQTTRIHQLCVICMRQKLKHAQKKQSLSLTLIPFLHSFVTRHNYTIHNLFCPSLPPWLAILAGCETCARMKMQEGRKILPTLSTLIVRIPPHLLLGCFLSFFFPPLSRRLGLHYYLAPTAGQHFSSLHMPSS